MRAQLTLPDALARSSNTVFYRLGLEAGSSQLLAAAKACGFGSKPGTGLANERGGELPDAEPGAPLANFAVGQGRVSATPLQVARAYAVIGTKGKRFPPKLVSKIGEKKVEPSPLPSDALGFEKSHYDTVIEGLVSVVNSKHGTGRRVRLDGTMVAGKTGTASWSPNTRVAWFVGFAPVEQPMYAIAVAVEGEPDEKVFGGKHAAPIAKELFEYLLGSKK